jgi:hypothetical protein
VNARFEEALRIWDQRATAMTGGGGPKRVTVEDGTACLVGTDLSMDDLREAGSRLILRTIAAVAADQGDLHEAIFGIFITAFVTGTIYAGLEEPGA